MPAEDMEVSWADPGGQRCSADLGAVAGIAFEDAMPVREFFSYRGQRHFPGLWWLATTGRHVGYESWLERDHVMALDFDRAVTEVSSRPFTLSWDGRGRRVSHTPDYFARLADGSGVVVDIRPADRVGPADAVMFEVPRQLAPWWGIGRSGWFMSWSRCWRLTSGGQRVDRQRDGPRSAGFSTVTSAAGPSPASRPARVFGLDRLDDEPGQPGPGQPGQQMPDRL